MLWKHWDREAVNRSRRFVSLLPSVLVAFCAILSLYIVLVLLFSCKYSPISTHDSLELWNDQITGSDWLARLRVYVQRTMAF